MFAASKTSTPSGGGPDPQFNYVTMLLHGDGTNGAQNNTFLDSSTNNFTITRTPNTTQGSFSPYGSNWSNYFDGDGDYLTTTWTPIGANQFTCEAWVFTLSNANRYYIVGPGTDTASHYDGFGFEIQGQTLSMWASSNGSTWNLVESDGSQGKSANPVPLNSWTHVAMTRDSSGVFRSFINGKLECVVSSGTAALADTSTSVLNIGRARYIGNFANFLGYISNLRIVNGSVVTAYSTSSTTIGAQIFIPPTSPLTAITNTSLLTCKANRFIDSSENYVITPSGNTSVQRFNPFGTATAYSTSVIGGSLYSDGTGMLQLPTSEALAPRTSNFTFECWIYLTQALTMTYQGIYVGDPANGPFIGQLATGLFGIRERSSADILSRTPPPINQWVHIAITRSGTNLRMFYNGIQQGATETNSTDFYSGSTSILDNQYPIYGYVSNLRFVKGSAVYTSNFTPPTSPVTAITNTSLLTNFTNGAIFDNAMMNDLETVGNAQISTSVVKYGTGSLAFDGTGDRLVGPATPNMAFGTGDYTIEFWCYPSNTGYGCFIDTRSANPNTDGVAIFNNGTSLEIYSQGQVLTASSAFTLNTWQFFALARSGTTLKAFVNGTQVGSTVTNSDNQTAGRVMIGDNVTIAYPLNGYIDDLRITKGYARYTANFTPPTAAFSNTGPY
jgi:hypothetical protein